MYRERVLEKRIKAKLFSGKAIVIYGPRQSGKTTMVKKIIENYSPADVESYTCDDVKQADMFRPDVESLRRIVKDKKIIFIDEAQAIENAGLVLKILVDNFPQTQIIATGSSAFELADKIKESMVGRVYSFTLLPFSASEIATSDKEKLLFDLDRSLRLGSYPGVVSQTNSDSEELLINIAESYLYKDLLARVTIRNESLLERLLKALALQVGQEVSFNELAGLLEVNRSTIERYIYLLEKTFVIFRLEPLSSNPRKVIASRKRKIYFYDLGIRSVISGQLGIPIKSNPQLGGIFENFCILEKMKDKMFTGKVYSQFYWRSQDSEVDYIEQSGEETRAFEFKWKKRNSPRRPALEKSYPGIQIAVVTSENYWDFIVA